jgi:hypothetical protein
MKRFVEGEDRTQGVLLPEFLDDYVAEDNPVRVIDVFVDDPGRLRAPSYETARRQIPPRFQPALAPASK